MSLLTRASLLALAKSIYYINKGELRYDELRAAHGDRISYITVIFMSYIWLSIVPRLRKIWIVDSFQGNYLKI